MEWKDVAPLLAKGAPIIGTILGGPVGGAAGAAVGACANLVASWLGCEPTPDAVSTALQTNPDAMLKLKELEVQERSRLLDWQEKVLAAVIQVDTNQTNTNIAEIQQGGKINQWRSGLGWVIVASFAWHYLVALMVGTIFACFDATDDIIMPAVDVAELYPLLLGMLGLSTIKAVEKIKGVA